MKTNEEPPKPQVERKTAHIEPSEESPPQLERSPESPPELERKPILQLKRSPWPQRERSSPAKSGECPTTTTGEETLDIAPREGPLHHK